MNYYNSICIFIGILYVRNVDSQINDAESPCPQVFNYETSTSEYGKWYGTITIRSQVTLYGFWLDIILDREAESIGNWIGDVLTTNNIHYKIENKRQVLNAFSSTSIRFYVKYNPLNSAPRVKYIRLNGQQICSASNEVTTQTSTSSTSIRRTSNPRSNGRYPNAYTTMSTQVEALSLNNRNNSNRFNFDGSPEVYDKVTPSTTSEGESTYNGTNTYQSQREPSNSDTSSRETSNSFIKNFNTNTDVSNENNQERPKPTTYSQNISIYDTISNQNGYRGTSINNNERNKERGMQDGQTQYSRTDYESSTKIIYPSQNSKRRIQTPDYDNSNPVNSEGKIRPIIQDVYSRPNNNNRRTSTTQRTTIRTFTYDTKDEDYSDSNSKKDDSRTNDYYESDFGLPKDSKISPTPLPINDNSQEKCGIVAAQPRPLIVGGESTAGGQWPWHVAIYQTQTVDSKYICGGSLISTSHVITAAHCVTRKSTSRQVNPQTLTVYLGKYNLRKSTDAVQIMLVRKIIIHPQYNASNFYADLALLKFTKPCDYTIHVRPVCLWKDTETDLSNIIDREGTVVGWGFDEEGHVTEDLTLVKMPVVKQSTCLWSFKEFYTHFTSEQSYCAGFENGTSVCNGDSGGGMVFPNNENSYSPTWRLRGLVSIGVAKQNEYRCDPYHYVVFTDTAQFLDWIKERLLE